VIADELEPVFQAFKAVNPHMCVRKPDGKWVIEFVVEAPPKAIIKSDLTAIEFLNMVKSTQQNWVLPGTADATYSPGLNHNVSNTVTVRPDEWEKVADYLWDNRQLFTGVTLLASTGDKDFAFAPNEEITTPADEMRWNAILESYQPVDYTLMVEDSDETNLKGEVACAGGFCSIV
jgi:ribonucleoside-diphosphate reductase alpha chain